MSPAEEKAVEAERFKTQSDVMVFAARHPGALSGYFLQMCRRKAANVGITESKQLRDVSVTNWVSLHSGLSEVRDQKEAATIAAAVDGINRRDFEYVMDLLAQRLFALQSKAAKGGSWEKAAKLELIGGPGPSQVQGGMSRLVA